jgi:hypothetical protein
MPSSSTPCNKPCNDVCFSGSANKKQKKRSDSADRSDAVDKKAKTIKSVKPVDPAVIEQRRDAVYTRVLKLESKLAKDRALLAKYSAPNRSTSSDEEMAAADES